MDPCLGFKPIYYSASHDDPAFIRQAILHNAQCAVSK